MSALSLAGLAAGCPFDTRVPIPPGGGEIPEECRFTSATQPADVLVNLETAFGCASVGVDLLRGSLGSVFDFDAPDEDESVQQFVDGWESLAEPREGAVGQFTQHMGSLGEGEGAMLTLDAVDGDEANAPGGDGFVFENVPYVLEFLDGASTFARFEGEADIFVRLEGTSYAAYRWLDIDQGFPTMARFWFGGTDAGSTGTPNRRPRRGAAPRSRPGSSVRGAQTGVGGLHVRAGERRIVRDGPAPAPSRGDMTKCAP